VLHTSLEESRQHGDVGHAGDAEDAPVALGFLGIA
jgi:hypothetical protein